MRDSARRGWARTLGWLFLGAVGVGTACTSSPQLVSDDGVPTPGGSIPVTGGTGGGGAVGGGSAFDDDPVVTAPRTPPVISGGTLLALKSGGRVVVADSDRDRLLVVSLVTHEIEAEVPLGAGTEPGRLVEDAAGRVHVALRGTGQLVTLDTATDSIVGLRTACAAPRGLAYDAGTDSVIVACLEGSLVELPAAGGPATRVTQVAPDLRDVLVVGDQLVVTLFREAAVLYLNAERQVTKRITLPEVDGFTAAVAWRAIALPDGTVAVLHQRGFSGLIQVSDGPGIDGGAGGSTSAGAGGSTPRIDVGDSGSPGAAGASEAGMGGEGTFTVGTHQGYGATRQPCGQVVLSAVSLIDPSGKVSAGPSFDGGVLPVDIAVGGAGYFATAFAGSQFGNGLGIYDSGSLAAKGCLSQSPSIFSATGYVAVAFDPVSKVLVTQTREPALLLAFDTLGTGRGFQLDLGGESVADTGHDLFHTDAGGGIACASCHPEGTEDGRVWNFSDFGARRTQPLDVGLFGTAPFHWDGDLPTFSDLMGQVFSQRMGGPAESDTRVQALEEYLYTLPRRPARRDAADPAALRGQVLFESRNVGCATCHAGPTLSDGASADIGRGKELQVPSLIAVSARAPYMHDGCAKTLNDRFDPKCGGSQHGDVSHLTQTDVDDLVAYLESL